MKKKCTNSKCRKSFTTTENSYICPHCGKVYPRLHVVNDMVEIPAKSGNNAKVVSCESGVFIMDYGMSKIKTIRAVVRWTKNDLRAAKALVESAPIFIGKKDIAYKDAYWSDVNDAVERMLNIVSPIKGFIKELEENGCLYEIV